MSNLNRMKIFKTGDQVIKISAAIVMTYIGFGDLGLTLIQNIILIFHSIDSVCTLHKIETHS